MNPRVYETINRKRAGELPRSSAEIDVEKQIGSKGWNARGYLPHFDKPGTIQMVTFRLADAMPAARIKEWRALLAITDAREQRTKLERYIDLGHGKCLLRDTRVAGAVEEVFLRFDGRHYRMIAWVIMPNHVHLLFELWDMPLGQLLKAWKGASANIANRIVGRRGNLWQEDYWDRHIRNEAHFRKARHYVEWNPVKARLVRQPEEWPFGSANPKWQWSGEGRPCKAHLLNGPRRRNETKATE